MDKEAFAAYMRQWRRKHPESVLRTRLRRPLEKRREDWRKAFANARLRYPEKVKARKTIFALLRNGTITKPEFCQRCGLICTPQGHHKDYSKPSEIVWLCSRCHLKEHRS